MRNFAYKYKRAEGNMQRQNISILTFKDTYT